ncbi:hypothetical protein C8J57DRAFT_1337784, partial [Mycena rebaudengoi]
PPPRVPSNGKSAVWQFILVILSSNTGVSALDAAHPPQYARERAQRACHSLRCSSPPLRLTPPPPPMRFAPKSRPSKNKSSSDQPT